ncbi:MAG TPA: DUF362 domain-containing protein [bacterium (Candidatus Stahlbacteria)]|nr:DUF362 domain-containing protein [Candidatus Stahlbacteria bacterium]
MVDVYFLDLSKKGEESYEKRFARFLDETKVLKDIDRRKPCAIKFHPGEAGNIYYVKPQFLKIIYDRLGRSGFLTDTTTLYSGERGLATNYHRLVREHGFGFAPFIVADGLRGEASVEVDGCAIGSVIDAVTQMVVVSHFKGHMVTGFGGAIKNLGMGCSAKAGKLMMHSRSTPQIDGDVCQRCYVCVEYCPQDAISEEDPPVINYEKCIRCCGCLSVCPYRAIGIDWNAEANHTTERMVDYARAAVKGKVCVYINFLVDITRHCDCFHTVEPPITPDVGILASTDPVAIDKASFDLVEDAIKKAQPQTSPLSQIERAVKVGLGSGEYKLVRF